MDLRNNRNWVVINQFNPSLAAKIASQAGYLDEADVAAVAKEQRQMLLLVRCGNGRFLCPADTVAHFTTIIREHSEQVASTECDYVRDVSLPATPR